MSSANSMSYSAIRAKYIRKEYIQRILFAKMFTGSHRTIRTSALDAIENMMKASGTGKEAYLEEDHAFVVTGPNSHGLYEIVDGNHRFTLWTKLNEITDWPCYVIPPEVWYFSFFFSF